MSVRLRWSEGCQFDALFLVRLESLSLHQHRVSGRGNGGKVEIPGAVAGGDALVFRRLVGERYLGARNYGVGLVEHKAREGGGYGLCAARAGKTTSNSNTSISALNPRDVMLLSSRIAAVEVVPLTAGLNLF